MAKVSFEFEAMPIFSPSRLAEHVTFDAVVNFVSIRCLLSSCNHRSSGLLSPEHG
jgi:hypothetical protein